MTFVLDTALKNERLLPPWWSVSNYDAQFKMTFNSQLRKEVSKDHPLYGLETQIFARGCGDDCLYEIKGSRAVAQVHLTWKKSTEIYPYPLTTIYQDLNEWYEKYYIPEFYERLRIPRHLNEFEQTIIGFAIGFISSTEFEKYIYSFDCEIFDISQNSYLTFISVDFSNKNEILTTFDCWFENRFPNAKFNLTEINDLFSN